MQNEFLLFIRVIFTGLFFIVLTAGVYLFRNFEKLFAAGATSPSENSSARSLNKLQVFLIWAHAMVLSGSFALLLH